MMRLKVCLIAILLTSSCSLAKSGKSTNTPGSPTHTPIVLVTPTKLPGPTETQYASLPTPQKPTVTHTPLTKPFPISPDLQALVLSQASSNEIQALFGEPDYVSDYAEQGQVYHYYPRPGRECKFLSATFQNDMVQLLTVVSLEPEPGQSLSNLTAHFESQPEELYVNYRGQGDKVYVWAKQGLAIESVGEYIFVQQFFEPTEIQDYLADWGHVHPRTDPFLNELRKNLYSLLPDPKHPLPRRITFSSTAIWADYSTRYNMGDALRDFGEPTYVFLENSVQPPDIDWGTVYLAYPEHGFVFEVVSATSTHTLLLSLRSAVIGFILLEPMDATDFYRNRKKLIAEGWWDQIYEWKAGTWTKEFCHTLCVGCTEQREIELPKQRDFHLTPTP